MEKRFELNQDLVKHQCETWHEGSWIFFSCSTCGFLRKLNYETSELVLIHRGDPMVLHSGSHAPLSANSQTSPTAN